MKTLILNLPWSDTGEDICGVKSGSRWPHSTPAWMNNNVIPPLFLGILFALVKRDGNSPVHFIDCIAECIDISKLEERMRREAYDCLIAEVSTPSLYSDISILQRLKSRFPNLKLLVCGSHVTVRPEDLPEADFIVQGEYETTMAELVNKLAAANPPASRIIRSENLCDLRELPFPCWDEMPVETYATRRMKWTGEDREIELMSSRGCPFQCIFCLWPNVLTHHKVRYFPPERVVGEIETLYRKYQISGFYFNDDTFTLNKEHVTAICEGLLKKRLPIRWVCFAHSKTVDLETLKLMKRAGCCKVKYGVESGSEKILSEIRKGQTPDSILKAVALTRDAGIAVHTSYTIGYPGDTHETILETIRLARKINPDSYVVSIATPFPGTPFFDLVKSEGLLETEEWSNYLGTNRSVVRTRALSSVEIAIMRRDFESIMAGGRWGRTLKNFSKNLFSKSPLANLKKICATLARRRHIHASATRRIYKKLSPSEELRIQCWMPSGGKKLTSNRKRILSMIPLVREHGIVIKAVPALLRMQALVRFPMIFFDWLASHAVLVSRYTPQPKILFDFLMLLAPRHIIYDLDDAMYKLPDYLKDCTERTTLKEDVLSMVACSDSIIAANNYIAKDLALMNSRVSVVATAIDMDIFNPSARKSEGRDPKTVFGWTGAGKSHEVYLMELLSVIRAYPSRQDVVWKIYGIKDCNMLKDEVAKLPADINLEMEDWLDPEMMPPIIAGFDVGLMPMFDDDFTKGKCPTKLYEYMACGLPVVASKVSCASDVLLEGKTGFWAETTEEWVAKLKMLQDSPALRKEMGAQARLRIEKGYSLRETSQQLAFVIRKFLSGE